MQRPAVAVACGIFFYRGEQSRVSVQSHDTFLSFLYLFVSPPPSRRLDVAANVVAALRRLRRRPFRRGRNSCWLLLRLHKRRCRTPRSFVVRSLTLPVVPTPRQRSVRARYVGAVQEKPREKEKQHGVYFSRFYNFLYLLFVLFVIRDALMFRRRPRPRERRATRACVFRSHWLCVKKKTTRIRSTCVCLPSRSSFVLDEGHEFGPKRGWENKRAA